MQRKRTWNWIFPVWGNEMAKKGSSWEEILETYFPEMEVEAVMEMER